MSQPVVHIRTILTAGHSFSAPLPRRPMDGLEEASGPSHARVAARPGAISTKAMLVSLFGLSAVAAGALFLVHSLVVGDPSGSQRLGTPMAIPPPTSLTPTPALATTPSSRTSIPTPSAILAPPRTVPAAPLSRPRPKPLPRSHPYPFPVPTPLAAIPIQKAPSVQPPPEKASGTNPYDDVPSEDPLGSRL
jgi:hypothetical protein